MKKRFRIQCLFLAVVLCLGLLAGCSSAAPAVESTATVVTAGLTGRTNALVGKVEPAFADRYDSVGFRGALNGELWYTAAKVNGKTVIGIPDRDYTLIRADEAGNVLAEIPTGLTMFLEPELEGELYGYNVLNGIVQDTDGTLYLRLEQSYYAELEDGARWCSRSAQWLLPVGETGLGEPVELALPEELYGSLSEYGTGVVLNGQLWLLFMPGDPEDPQSLGSKTEPYALLAFSLKTGVCERVIPLPSTEMNGQLYFFQPDGTLPLADGRLLLTGVLFNAVTREGNGRDSVLYTLDVSGEEPVFSAPIPRPEGMEETAFIKLVRGMQNTVTDGVYLFDSSGVYLWDEADNAAERIYEWTALSIEGYSVQEIHLLSEDRMLLKIARMQNGMQTSSLRILTPADPDVLEARPTVTLGVAMQLSAELSALIEEYNAVNPDQVVQIVSYTDTDAQAAGLGGAEELLLRDILQHTGPDVMLLPANLNSHDLVRRGALLDLYPLLDADPELSRTDFSANILAACESNGTLPTVVPYYNILTLAGDPDRVGDDMGMTWQQFNALLAANPQAKAPVYGVGRNILLLHLLQLGGSRFIDYPAAKAHLDTAEFAGLLKTAAGFPEEAPGANEDPKQNFAVGSSLFKMVYSGLDAQRILVYEFDGPVVFKGYPTDAGVGCAALPAYRLAISADCADPTLAWNFLRTFLLPDAQRTLTKQVGFIPLRVDVLEEQLNALTVPLREPAYPVYLFEQVMQNGATAAQQEYFSRALTEEELARTRALIDAVTVVYQYDAVAAAILAEEASAFYAGVHSAEEAAQLIQNRVQTYLDEQS